MFNLAEVWGLRPDGSNPVRHIEKYPERKVERMLSGSDLAHLGAALSAYEGSPYAVAAFRLLIFTGARLDEIQSLRWDEVDFERAELRLASHKSDKTAGVKVIHLPAPALAVLNGLMKIQGNPYVIAGLKPGSHMVNLKRAWETVRAKATVSIWREHDDPAIAKLVADLSEKLKREPSYEECLRAAEMAGLMLPTGLVDLRRHDLRHTFASIAASSGMGLVLIGKMLGHTQAQTTQRYAHLAADPVKSGVASVARQLEAAMEGRKTSAKISDISGARG
jgi:integrase